MFTYFNPYCNSTKNKSPLKIKFTSNDMSNKIKPIDVTSLNFNTSEQETFLKELKTKGIVELKFDNLTTHLIKSTFNDAHQLFNQPEATLRKLSFHDVFYDPFKFNQENHRGYLDGYASHRLIPVMESEKGTGQGQFSFKPSYVYFDKLWEVSGNHNVQVPTKIVPEFNSSTKNLIEKLTSYSDNFRDIISLDSHDVDKRLKSMTTHKDTISSHHLKVLFYPFYENEELEQHDFDKFYRTYEHTDRGSLFTIIFQSKNQGLEVKLPSSNSWQRLNSHEPFSCYLLVGERLAQFTNQQYKSVPHRVTGNKSEMLENRVSLAYFYRPNPFENWYDINANKILEFKNRPLTPGLWHGLLLENDKANFFDLVEHASRRIEGYSNLKKKVEQKQYMTVA